MVRHKNMVDHGRIDTYWYLHRLSEDWHAWEIKVFRHVLRKFLRVEIKSPIKAQILEGLIWQCWIEIDFLKWKKHLISKFHKIQENKLRIFHFGSLDYNKKTN